MTDESVLEVSLHIAAAPETVFPYFVDPARYVRWMGNSAVLEPVPGGAYRVNLRDGARVEGAFVEVDPPHRVVFTWGWTNDDTVAPGTTTVVVTLTEEDGGTRVVLRHHDLPDDERRDLHRTGWELYLDRLRTRVLGGETGRDPNS